MSKIFIVATPIGNLEDITFRALDTLKKVDVILAEDKRVSKKLVDHYKIDTPLAVWHQHSKGPDWKRVNDFLKQDKNIALITDAGTPGFSDPGGKLIELAIENFPDVEIIPIPGPSTVGAILSVAGIPLDKFLFLGFLPHKKGRQTIIQEVKDSKVPIIFFESVHRIMKTLDQLSDCKKQLIVGRELTKQFETIYRGTAKEILDTLEKNKDQQKGEFVVVVNK